MEIQGNLKQDSQGYNFVYKKTACLCDILNSDSNKGMPYKITEIYVKGNMV
jgi:hypothetical protein